MARPGTIAITDFDWYSYLSQQRSWDEVNFWKPTTTQPFRAPEFSPFFFKLKAPLSCDRRIRVFTAILGTTRMAGMGVLRHSEWLGLHLKRCMRDSRRFGRRSRRRLSGEFCKLAVLSSLTRRSFRVMNGFRSRVTGLNRIFVTPYTT